MLFGTRIVCKEVGQVTAIYFDSIVYRRHKQVHECQMAFTCYAHDILAGPVPGNFDGVFTLDVLEHIAAEDEGKFPLSLSDRHFSRRLLTRKRCAPR
jgi:hypothetical protein